MGVIAENKKAQKNRTIKRESSRQVSEDDKPQNHVEEDLDILIDENLITLKKIHAILINCVNLTKKQKSEFAESERFFMKLHLKKLIDKIKDL